MQAIFCAIKQNFQLVYLFQYVHLPNFYTRFEEEKDALMAKLLGANNQFLSERERQALLARLKREQLKAKLEEKFGSAALVLGLAERQRKNAEER